MRQGEREREGEKDEIAAGREREGERGREMRGGVKAERDRDSTPSREKNPTK